MEPDARQATHSEEVDDLLEALTQIRTEISTLRSSHSREGLAGQPGDLVDLAEAVAEADQSLVISDVIDDHQREVERALQLASEGRYGSCEDCGEPISAERLKFRPESTRCVQCQSVFDRSQRMTRLSDTA
jgi:DnaK suppressor protein